MYSNIFFISNISQRLSRNLKVDIRKEIYNPDAEISHRQSYEAIELGYLEDETLLRVSLNRSAKWPHAFNRYLSASGINVMHVHVDMQVRTPRVVVPNRDQTYLINRTFTDLGKFKTVLYSIAICIDLRCTRCVDISNMSQNIIISRIKKSHASHNAILKNQSI